jgi:hypothetical protein
MRRVIPVAISVVISDVMPTAIPAAIAALITATFLSASAFAKLPPLNDEAKAKAAETAAKAAWTDKVGAYQLCRAMDRTADYYRKSVKPGEKPAPAPVQTPACVDPGPYAAAAASAPPLEAAGAHSPPATAVAPPSSNATAAEIQGKSKK